MSGTKVQCVAVLGKRNNPLYLRVLQHNEERLKCHYIVHSSLDVVDAKSLPNAIGFVSHTYIPQPTIAHGIHAHVTVAGNSEGRYLGLLEAQENYKVYGYITCTQTKFIVVFDDVPINENVAKDVCSCTHALTTLGTQNKSSPKPPYSSLSACTPSTQTPSQTRSMCRTRRSCPRALTETSSTHAISSPNDSSSSPFHPLSHSSVHYSHSIIFHMKAHLVRTTDREHTTHREQDETLTTRSGAWVQEPVCFSG